jgi:ubiquinone/menaquinone biosynthesis C-methylase UbiE
MPPEPSEISYSAKEDYQDFRVGETYEELRFSSRLGRYTRRREQAAVSSLLQRVPSDSKILDCPCGTGRWWPVLAQRARSITAVDISKGMLDHARRRASASSPEVEVLEADAELLPFEDKSFDLTFSFALTKHLPVPVQYRVLSEFARVSRWGVICTFGLLGHVSYEVWRRRRLEGSFPVFPEELGWMAGNAGLTVIERRRCTTPVGTEHVVLMSPAPAG